MRHVGESSLQSHMPRSVVGPWRSYVALGQGAQMSGLLVLGSWSCCSYTPTPGGKWRLFPGLAVPVQRGRKTEEQEPEWQQAAPVLQGTELFSDVTNCWGNESLAFLPSPGDRCVARTKPGWGAGDPSSGLASPSLPGSLWARGCEFSGSGRRHASIITVSREC